MRSHLYVTDLVSNLYTVDPATGSAGLVGPTGMALTDIAFHGPTLYGITSHQLVRLNPDTGAAVAIGSPFGPVTNGLAVSEEGVIYAGGGGQLFTIDPATGALYGPPKNFGGGLTSGGDLAFDSNGVLYGTLNVGGGVSLCKINPTTGASQIIGPTSFSTVNGLAFYCCKLFGCTSGGELLSLSLVNGHATLIGKAAPPFLMGGMSARPCCC